MPDSIAVPAPVSREREPACGRDRLRRTTCFAPAAGHRGRGRSRSATRAPRTPRVHDAARARARVTALPSRASPPRGQVCAARMLRCWPRRCAHVPALPGDMALARCAPALAWPRHFWQSAEASTGPFACVQSRPARPARRSDGRRRALRRERSVACLWTCSSVASRVADAGSVRARAERAGVAAECVAESRRGS